MNTIHLYLRRGPSAGLLVVRHTFNGAPTPLVTRSLVPASGRTAWLEALVLESDLKAVYNCHESGATKPEGLGCPWFDLPAGHPCEKL
jgi:hypothetical protein